MRAAEAPGGGSSAALPPGWPAGVGLSEFREIDSTNEEARRQAAAGARGPLWIRAETQSAGRGRRGRSWTSEPGNLFATLLAAPGCALPRAAEISFVAGLAVHDAACAAAPALADRLSLKWPNDLLLDGAKVSGILIETAAGPGGHDERDPLLAVGIGVNLASHPQDVPYPAGDLAQAGVRIAARDFLARLAAAMQARMRQWQDEGFGAVRAAWLGRAAGLGGPMTVRLPDGEITGEFVSLDADGALALRTAPDGTLRRITAGDVFFPARGPGAG